jgi:hypothetical protein
MHGPSRFPPAQDDVFILFKRWAADSSLCQPPLLAFLGAQSRADTERFLNEIINHPGVRGVCDPNRALVLEELAKRLGDFPQYGRGIAYLRSLANEGSELAETPPELDFLHLGPQRFPLPTAPIVEPIPLPREVRSMRVVRRRQ